MIAPYRSATLVDRFVPAALADEVLRSGVPAIRCSEEILLDCERIADGGLTPLTGFFDEEQTWSVLTDRKLPSGEYFPIPILLQADASLLGTAQRTVALIGPAGRAAGWIEHASVFRFDLDRLCSGIFGVGDRRHPGVAKLVSGGDVFVGGRLHLAPFAGALSRYCLSPRDVRAEMARRGWRTAAGFHTRNVPHRAHEHLQRIALELVDGLLLHPVVGWKRPDDYGPDVILRAYDHVVRHVYPSDRVLLSGLQLRSRYAGPAEAILHAIVRQNYGCTHFIVGRDHAGVDGYYGKYAAHELVEEVQEFLDIQVLRLSGPFYCPSCGTIATERSCGHDPDQRIDVAASELRKLIESGAPVDPRLIRPEIVDIVRAASLASEGRTTSIAT